MKIICKYLSWLAIIFSTIIFALPSAYASPTVLFDEGHKEVFLTGKTGEFDLSRFAEILVFLKPALNVLSDQIYQ